ncbi:hypothetical protein AU381_23005 [Sinorhizobium glycinis]|uniref:Uncharacterized protein n=1 Tax=Sinorhizobium glycinis TaxID=1472378 RepID=A0A178XT38_9HYPH|nr:hypothetical protein AU381_23005 [Sinorhizobium glycinis]
MEIDALRLEITDNAVASCIVDVQKLQRTTVASHCFPLGVLQNTVVLGQLYINMSTMDQNGRILGDAQKRITELFRAHLVVLDAYSSYRHGLECFADAISRANAVPCHVSPPSFSDNTILPAPPLAKQSTKILLVSIWASDNAVLRRST